MTTTVEPAIAPAAPAPIDDDDAEEGEWDGEDDIPTSENTAPPEPTNGIEATRADVEGSAYSEEVSSGGWKKGKNGGNGNRNGAKGVKKAFSREDLHAEQWDDAALIDAWDAAVREFQMFHSDKPPTGGLRKNRRTVHKPATPPAVKGDPVPMGRKNPKNSGCAGIQLLRVEEPGTASQSPDSAPPPQPHADTAYNAPNGQNQYTEHIHTPGPTHATHAGHQCPSCGDATPASMSSTAATTAATTAAMAPPLPSDPDLANVVLAWYYAGYYSGVYAAKETKQ
ncbi:uncharacterized protein EV422DRAFT_572241 [Fimicolochytrium jonesii]|uniref:uncharacterized protein n=1 Tax=Fimicolochytrium jonesii TaxID=1396493 RepID=UPI0022FEAF6A|nr:uncharacterized protein EV422DRAFT_572241 [Fimicolochytrium jonesii]KAI8816024.1 hypothetical protein EV422DRAFT_572241 [Fimicolochytrium jonesii]